MSSAAIPYVAAITDALHAMLPDGYEGQRAAGCEIHRDDTVTQPGHTSAPWSAVLASYACRYAVAP